MNILNIIGELCTSLNEFSSMLRMKLELLVKSIVKARYGTSKNPFFFFC